MNSLLYRLYRIKLTLLAVLLLTFGLLLLFLGHWIEVQRGLRWLRNWPFVDIGSGMFTTGLLGVALHYIDGTDSEARDTERLRRILADAAPAMRDAVISGFAETPDNMRGVATTATLDKLVTNALALRLGDEQFASEVYSGVLAQAIRTQERWYGVDVSVRFSRIPERSAVGAPRSEDQSELFDVVVTWEYTVQPQARVQRFASTSDPQEFRDFLDDVPTTSAWLVTRSMHIDSRDRDAFELLSYSVDGEDLTIRRSVRKSGQTYSVDLGDERLAKREPIRVRHVYRTVSRKVGHRFRVALTQPAEGLHVSLDYTDTDIAELRVGELVSSAVPAQIKFLPAGAPAKQVEVNVPGWLLPQSEVTFVWTLEDELSPRP